LKEKSKPANRKTSSVSRRDKEFWISKLTSLIDSRNLKIFRDNKSLSKEILRLNLRSLSMRMKELEIRLLREIWLLKRLKKELEEVLKNQHMKLDKAHQKIEEENNMNINKIIDSLIVICSNFKLYSLV
jgi:hypothetical protein